MTINLETIAYNEPKAKPGRWWLTTGIILLSGLIIIFIVHIAPRFIPAKASGTFTACQSNCRNISTALFMYYSDHNCNYPITLDELVPAYIKEIPTCPNAQKDTYSVSYVSSNRAGDHNFTFFCTGEYHKKHTGTHDYPKYSGLDGLIVKP